ncbi:methionyl-tRNA formyltransferase [Corynebacterium phocae]|uniref:Methionyl-tRNA formyltransferase n=1 Tax=Corynebacterium phocae TaxID=161895 RepID=A0A1L7D2Z4_9CORY|nr:methionyl-tRNA formyltransferase [Corynebacterium phocae]APT92470.1 methionyl-tRNA formyltransferase [Corynebacterium phocae]KAA8725075.1 methionyl-tRNA formyltransferase [Corynebacterium phocae]
MRIIFAGTPEPAVVALESLLASKHEVVAVITRPDARKGRGRTLHPSPVKALALEHDIEVLTPTSLKPDTEDGQALRAALERLRPDAIPVVAYGNLITPDLLDAAPHGWVNLHFSLLPAWRGAAPVQAAIAAGDRVTGATTFRIDEGLDTGVILGTVKEEILPTDTADDLLTRLAYKGADLLVETMDGLEAGDITGKEQVGQATYAHKITTEDARVPWDTDAAGVDRHIRAHTPGPGAWTQLQGQRFKVGPVTITEREDLSPGEIAQTKSALFVGTGSVAVELGKIQPPGKKMMAAADWARGALKTGADKDESGVMFQ